MGRSSTTIARKVLDTDPLPLTFGMVTGQARSSADKGG